MVWNLYDFDGFIWVYMGLYGFMMFVQFVDVDSFECFCFSGLHIAFLTDPFH